MTPHGSCLSLGLTKPLTAAVAGVVFRGSWACSWVSPTAAGVALGHLFASNRPVVVDHHGRVAVEQFERVFVDLLEAETARDERFRDPELKPPALLWSWPITRVISV